MQKVIVFFPERGEEIKTSFWHIWITLWLKFFPTTAHFFYFGHLQRKRGVKVGPKVVTLDLCLFYEYSNPSKTFQTGFLFARPPKKSYFVDAELVCKTLEIFNLTTTNAILMKLTTIMYPHESVNWKALGAKNSFFFFGLIYLHHWWSFCLNWMIFVGVFHEKTPKIGSK